MHEAEVTGAGWEARLQLQFAARGDRTRLVSKRQSGPLTLQRPFYPEDATCHGYILHPPGGVVGGDALQIEIEALEGAHCLLTTPGATKFYRAGAQRACRVSQRIAVAEGAIAEWLPQQNIFFPGAHAALATGIEIAPGGRYLGWEIHCLGRPANAEVFHDGSLHSLTRVSVGGELRLAERLHIPGPDALRAATGMRGMPMLGCFIAAPCIASHRDQLEQILQAQCPATYPHPIGITLVDEVLVIRALGEQTEPLQRLFTLLWAGLRQSWLGKPPCAPRIWST